MKNFVLTLLLFLSFNGIVKAQSADNNVVIKGMILDSATLNSIPFATISLYQKNELVNGTFTDSLGRFEMKDLRYGTYYITFSMIGYRSLQTATWTLNDGNPVVDLGKLKVISEVKNLKAVTIRGQKPLIEQRADRITFNVESMPPIAGSDASDILRKVPLLSVDPNGGISMRGSSNIKVFIDGKPSEIYASSVSDALKAISGENIVKVEVITNPSAKYDAEGTDGVINIITRKNINNATNGNVRGVFGNRSESIMTDVHSKYGKWLVNLDAFYQKYWNRNGSELHRETESFGIVQKNESRQSGDYFFGGFNVFYSLDSLNTLNIGYRARRSPNVTTNVFENYKEENEKLIPSFQRKTLTPNCNNGNSVNIGYTGTSKNGRREFSLLGIYFLFKGTNSYNLEQTQNEIIDYKENFDSKTLSRDFTVQGDYSQSFNDRWKWEAGIKVSQKNMDSKSLFGVYNFSDDNYINDDFRSNRFSYINSIYALYNSLSVKTKKWGFTAGVRYEHTSLTAVFKDTSLRVPSFDNVVPQILINRVFNERTNLKIGYTMKLVRPYISYLNPTINRSDSLTTQFGNPYLRPEITNRYQISYTRDDPKLFKDIAIFFNDNRNSIENIRTPVSGGIFESTWKNIGRNQRLGLSANLTWKPSGSVSMGATFTGQYVKLNSPALNITNSGLIQQLVINGSFKLANGYSIDCYGFFDSRNLRLQGYRSGWKFYNVTISKQSKDKRFNLSLRMETFLTPHTFINEEVITESFYQMQTFRYQNQNFRLTFSYKLGKKEIKNPKMRQVENGD